VAVATLSPGTVKSVRSGRADAVGIIFEPAVVVTEDEARFMANAVLVAQIEDSRAHPERGRSRPVRRI
jgi:hypothetical protein